MTILYLKRLHTITFAAVFVLSFYFLSHFNILNQPQALAASCTITNGPLWQDPADGHFFGTGGPFSAGKVLNLVVRVNKDCSGKQVKFNVYKGTPISATYTKAIEVSLFASGVNEADIIQSNTFNEEGSYTFKVFIGTDLNRPDLSSGASGKVDIVAAPFCNYTFESFNLTPKNPDPSKPGQINSVNEILIFDGRFKKEGRQCTYGNIKILAIGFQNQQVLYIGQGDKTENFSLEKSPAEFGVTSSIKTASFKAQYFSGARSDPSKESGIKGIGIGEAPTSLETWRCVNPLTSECTKCAPNESCSFTSEASCNSSLACGGTGGNVPTGQPGEPQTIEFKIENPLAVKTVKELLEAIAKALFNLVLIVAPIVIIYAGVLFLKSRGEPAEVTKARKALTYALLGLAVVFIGKGFVALIEDILGGPAP